MLLFFCCFFLFAEKLEFFLFVFFRERERERRKVVLTSNSAMVPFHKQVVGFRMDLSYVKCVGLFVECSLGKGCGE